MKKYSKALSSIALLLAMILCFSGCSVIDYARSAIKRDPVTSEIVTEIVGGAENVVPNNNTQATQSVVVTTQKGTSAQSTTKPSTTAGSSTTATTEPTEGSTAGTTQAPIIDENTSVEDIKDMPVKEVQDLLFATDDEATARKILLAAGFEYDEAQGIYYSQMNPLQRKFGFNFVYDMAAPLTGMYYSTKRIEFEYAGKEWMVQIWKGQYGITAGAEIGLYSRDPSKVMQYDCADDTELIEMQFDFYNMGEYVFSRGPEKHWWLTGFKVAHIGVPYFIEMDMTLNFEDNQMANAFVAALKKQAMTDPLDPMTYTRSGSKINIIW
ncbi:MAG: DUF4474 domain-containing protein [Clostridia bacterium]|nr:DUF4474 domain-containing protein [Clostridia bacterium]